MADFASWSFTELRLQIGIEKANLELDKRSKIVFDTLRDITSVCSSSKELGRKLRAMKDRWFGAVDQYERTPLHLAALNGNTMLVCGLIEAGALVNAKDGIGQTGLTLALHMSHFNTARTLIMYGSSVGGEFYKDTVPPLEIARVKENAALVSMIQDKIDSQRAIYESISSHFPQAEKAGATSGDSTSGAIEMSNNTTNYGRKLNINVGDQKNTVTIQGCANRCPDVYGCHTPGGGDFHARGYVNESIARIAGQGGFWHVTEHVMKRPTVNPKSFKDKFKDNNYNNNEEALLDYDDGLSLAMVKTFQASEHFPSPAELEDCLERTGSHNEILLKKFQAWLAICQNDQQFSYHSDIVNNLMPITRWYKESVRNGNGVAIEGVWMLCPALFAQVGKTNYRDEAFTQVVNSTAKWPLAYRKLYQQNRTVNLDGKQGKQLAGDEWVEGYLVKPIKQFATAQSSFSMVEMMSCSTNLLEMNRQMYRSREAFNMHGTKKHKKPSSLYDHLKVAQFALKEELFENKERTTIPKFAWGDKKVKPGEQVQSKYIDAYQKGDKKAKSDFPSFLERKYPNEMI